MIPIDRGGGNASARALDTAARLLEDGELFGIYPEGTRARDGFLHKGTPARRDSLSGPVLQSSRWGFSDSRGAAPRCQSPKTVSAH